MTLGQYITAISVLALIGWGLVLAVVFNIDPTAAGRMGLIYFYVSLFFAVMTTATVLGLLWRRLFVRYQPVARQVATALRQGVLFAIAVTVGFLLLSFGLLSGLNTVLLIILLGGIEFFAHGDRRTTAPDLH